MTNTKEYFKKQSTQYLKRQLKLLASKRGMADYKKEIKEVLKKRLNK